MVVGTVLEAGGGAKVMAIVRASSLVPLAVFALASVSRGQSSFLTRPDVHGDRIVFTAEGDLWLGSVSGGEARRITTHPGTETAARFSPDGTMIAFTADYDGSLGAVYVMPTGGGAPKRLTFDGSRAVVQGWTPDGKGVLYRSAVRSPVRFQNELFTVPAAGGVPTLVPVPRGEFGAMAPDGRLAYVPVSAEWMNWFHYRGGAADDIWLADLKGGFRRLTTSTGVDTCPTWAGGAIYMASDTGAQMNLCRLDPGSGKTVPITRYTDAPVRYPSSDGKRVVFEHGAGLTLYDPAAKEPVRELSFALDSDRIHAREMRVPLAPAMTSALPSPNGGRVAVEARGQIVTVAAKEGDLRVLAAKPGTRNWLGCWSPDGKRLAFISDEGGEQQLWTVDAAGSRPPVQLTKTLKGELNTPKWSPDGKWIVLADRQFDYTLVDAATGATKTIAHVAVSSSYDDLLNDFAFSPDGKWVALVLRPTPTWSSIALYEIATGTLTTVSPEGVACSSPSFDPTGKTLAYLASRDLSPSDAGLHATDRLQSGDAGEPRATRGGRDLAVLAEDGRRGAEDAFPAGRGEEGRARAPDGLGRARRHRGADGGRADAERGVPEPHGARWEAHGLRRAGTDAALGRAAAGDGDPLRLREEEPRAARSGDRRGDARGGWAPRSDPGRADADAGGSRGGAAEPRGGKDQARCLRAEGGA